MEKLTKINIHLHGQLSFQSLCDVSICLPIFDVFEIVWMIALFAAVEFGQVEKARAILEDNEVDINR